MSDEQMPAWAQAMENRLGAKIESGQQALKDLELKLGAKIDAGEHALLKEVGKAINDSETRLEQRIAGLRAEMTRRFDQVHDDLTVNLARADLAVERVQRLESDVRQELSLLQRRLRELEQWRDHLPDARP